MMFENTLTWISKHVFGPHPRVNRDFLAPPEKYPKYGVELKGGLGVDPKRTLRVNLRFEVVG